MAQVQIDETREPISMLHYQYTNPRIGQQLLELGPFLIEAGCESPSLRHYVKMQSFDFPI